MHFMEVGGWRGLKPAENPEHLRGAEAPLFHGEAVFLHSEGVLLAFSATGQSGG